MASPVDPTPNHLDAEQEHSDSTDENGAARPTPDRRRSHSKELPLQPSRSESPPASSPDPRKPFKSGSRRGQDRSTPPKNPWTKTLSNAMQYGPLLAAVFAPISTLLSIPALTQNWFLLDGAAAPDPGKSLIISAISLATNVLANALLVLRFTVSEKRWRMATVASIACWWLTIIFSTTNLAVYGALSRNAPGYRYDEGFWCNVGCTVVGGLITLVLSVHYILRFDRPSSEGALIRVAGKEFISTVTLFIGLLGIEGLIFSQLEHWTFLQGVYFSLVTAFTIGFGDFEVTRAVSKVLLFPLAVLSIALLTVQIGVLVDFITSTAPPIATPPASDESHIEQDNQKALVEEIASLQDWQHRQKVKRGAINLAISTGSLIVFWVIAAFSFRAIEGFEIGNSFYFCYVFFLTIGYGDDSPTTPGGRVFFVIYALLAVPVVTNFVLNTVTSLLSAATSYRYEKSRDKYAPTTAEKRVFHSHAFNVHSSAQRLAEHYEKHPVEKHDEEKELSQIVLGLALRLEAQASTIMLSTLADSDKSRTLLQADRNLQRRAQSFFSDADIVHHGYHYASTGTVALEAEMQDEVKDSEDILDPAAPSNADTLELIRRYRETFAGLLAAGSLMMKLEGKGRLKFERRLEHEEEKDAGGMLLGSGREGPAEKAYGLDV